MIDLDGAMMLEIWTIYRDLDMGGIFIERATLSLI